MHRLQVHVVFLNPKVPHQSAVHVSGACFTLGSNDTNRHDDEGKEAAGADASQHHKQGDEGLTAEAKAAFAVGSSSGWNLSEGADLTVGLRRAGWGQGLHWRFTRPWALGLQEPWAGSPGAGKGGWTPLCPGQV